MLDTDDEIGSLVLEDESEDNSIELNAEAEGVVIMNDAIQAIEINDPNYDTNESEATVVCEADSTT